jgi:hypothetical protein
VANACKEAMTMSKLVPETRGVVDECQECGVQLHPADVHEPHDPECTRSALGHEAGSCRCDNTTCPACCWQCNPPEIRHRYDDDSEGCRCGGEVVWFEDGDDRGDIGEGCEVAGLTWVSLRRERLQR